MFVELPELQIRMSQPEARGMQAGGEQSRICRDQFSINRAITSRSLLEVIER